jgi:hypothetical protein
MKGRGEADGKADQTAKQSIQVSTLCDLMPRDLAWLGHAGLSGSWISRLFSRRHQSLSPVFRLNDWAYRGCVGSRVPLFSFQLSLLYFTFLPPSVRPSLSSLILARLLCLFFFFFSSSTSSLAIHIVFLDVVILCINSILVSNEVTTSFYYESLPRPLRPLLVPCVIFQTLRFSCSRSLPQISDLPGSSLAMSYLF